ncbi:hypothetical protein [Paenarthrobacter ilicis]|uniref:hypothetical protein n=1 Tax=Paenarthrobacter ilicis TaxID=43665 RepID=UPI00386F2EA6
MPSEKFETMNHFIAEARKLRELILALPDSLRSGTSVVELMKQDVSARLDLVRAARTVLSSPHDPDADKIIGAVLLGRIDTAASVLSLDEWETAAAEAKAELDLNHEPENSKMRAWMDTTKPVVDLGFEAMRRAEEQGHEIMLEGFRRAAGQTPGANLHISETVNGTLLSEETILGPQPGTK